MSVCLIAVFAMSLTQTAPSPAAAGRVSGRVVVDGTGAPIPGARVTIFPSGPRNVPFGPPPQSMTNDEGRFVLTSVAPGEYRIDVQKTGYAPLTDEPGSGQKVQVPADRALDGLELRLQRGAVITGRVLDASGAPLPDVRIMALKRLKAPQGAPPRLMPAGMQGMHQTNDLGEFRVAGLPAGEYFIAAVRSSSSMFGGPGVAPSADGTAMTTTFYPGTIDQSAAHPIIVGQGETVANIEFAMQSAPAFRISGRVVDESDQPVAGALVMLIVDPRGGAFMGPAGHAQTGDDGRFSIAEVPAGAYRLSASVPMRIDRPVESGAAGGVSGGVVGGVSGGAVRAGSAGMVWSVNGSGADASPVDVTVTNANATGVRLIVHR